MIGVKPNRSLTKVLLGYIFLPWLPVALYAASVSAFHTVNKSRFERDFAALSHPAQTHFVARAGQMGLFANGNHCDYLVAEVRSFSGSKIALQNFYREMRIAVPNKADDAYSDVKNGTQPLEVEFLSSPLPAHYHWRVSQNEVLDLSRFAGAKNLYVVSVLNSGENYAWDSTCG